jgi:hypothetical protein
MGITFLGVKMIALKLQKYFYYAMYLRSWCVATILQ